MICINIAEIKQLSKETSVSILEAKHALKVCKNYDIAKEYLHQKHTAVARYKIINGKKMKLTDNDYIELANQKIRT